MPRPRRPGRVPADATRWSASSKRSASYDFPPQEYEDIEYSCWRCRKAAVYTAQEQQEAFEVRKVYIWQRRILCPRCFKVRVRLESEIGTHARRWKRDRVVLQGNKRFLRRWLKHLEALPGYGGRTNTAGIAMLQRLLKAHRKAEGAAYYGEH